MFTTPDTLYTTTYLIPLFIVDFLIYLMYFLDRDTAHHRSTQIKHKFFGDAKKALVMLAHIVGGWVEWAAGAFALYMWASFSEACSSTPQSDDCADGAVMSTETFLATHYGALICLLAALLLHIPSSYAMTPKVWGLKYITVTGYAAVSTIRFICAFYAMNLFVVHVWGQQSRQEGLWNTYFAWMWPSAIAEPLAEFCGRILCVGTLPASASLSFKLHLALQRSWTCQHMAHVVRIVSRYIVPHNAPNRPRGALLTDPFLYTASVSVAVFVVVPLILPAWFNVVILFVGVACKFIGGNSVDTANPSPSLRKAAMKVS